MNNYPPLKSKGKHTIANPKLWYTEGTAVSQKVTITKICPCNIQNIFLVEKIENFIRKLLIFFHIFAQNIDCEYTLERVLTIYFWSKNKKKGIPLHTLVLLYKIGVQGGIYFTDMFS